MLAKSKLADMELLGFVREFELGSSALADFSSGYHLVSAKANVASLLPGFEDRRSTQFVFAWRNERMSRFDSDPAAEVRLALERNLPDFINAYYRGGSASEVEMPLSGIVFSASAYRRSKREIVVDSAAYKQTWSRSRAYLYLLLMILFLNIAILGYMILGYSILSPRI